MSEISQWSSTFWLPTAAIGVVSFVFIWLRCPNFESVYRVSLDFLLDKFTMEVTLNEGETAYGMCNYALNAIPAELDRSSRCLEAQQIQLL